MQDYNDIAAGVGMYNAEKGVGKELSAQKKKEEAEERAKKKAANHAEEVAK